MHGRQFYCRICEDPELEWLGCVEAEIPADDYVGILHRPSGCRWALGVQQILNHSWEELHGVLTWRRGTRALAWFRNLGFGLRRIRAACTRTLRVLYRATYTEAA